jgi:pSer/pThr/pTyr-binding forkhead associated (FHA) protein
MALCPVCGTASVPGSSTCSMCGTTIPEPGAVPSQTPPVPPPSRPPLPVGEVLAPGTRLCPGCGQSYGPDYADSFCACGMELYGAEQLPAAILEDPPTQEQSAEPAGTSAETNAPARPPAGTRCLVLYDAQKRPLAYFPLDKEALLIGRLDAVAGNFPDIDVTQWLDPAVARKVSRKHALVLKVRATGAYLFRPLAGNTGTQVDDDMVAPLCDCLLEPGRRIILGGAARLKFEIT